MTGNSEVIARGANGRSRIGGPEISLCEALICVSCLCIQSQTAAVRMFLRFFRLSILAFEVGERYIQRLVPEPFRMT